jgi:hypothetical protein
MNKSPKTPLWRRHLIVPLGLALLLASPATVSAQSVSTSRENYFPLEAIDVSFTGGPGNPKDWIGVYPDGVEPGSVGSTLWNYVGGSRTPGAGLTEGTVSFPGGLGLAGTWRAFLLVNDGYTQVTNVAFNILEPTAPAVRLDVNRFTTGQPITVGFTNGPANPKDWVGIYKADEVPGAVSSTRWLYVDGTTSGNKGLGGGSVTFPSGLATAGLYRVFLLENDGYTVLASEPIMVTTPTTDGPRILSSSPGNGAVGVAPNAPFQAVLTNGVNIASIQLRLDGLPVVASVTGTADSAEVTYTNSTLLAPGSTHTYLLAFSGTGSPAPGRTTTNTFTVSEYRNIILGTAVVFENFDSIPEGEIPSGWTRKSYTEVLNPEVDFGNLDSAAYAQWTAVDASRFNGSFITYSNPETPESEANDYRRVNRPNPSVVFNGRILDEPLGKGRLLFADSGYRRGASQVLYLFTKDFDLTGRTGVEVAFKSLWEQNQDSIASVEYSIDGGAQWLPVAYFVDTADIQRNPEGGIDAEATLNTERGDIARYLDENGVERGGAYGAFIGAPVTAGLAPFIQGRVNDDPVESKRYELFRLPAADNQPRVRMRFAHAGTDSWYWGLDDFGIYASPGPETSPTLSIVSSGGRCVISWPSTVNGYTLESSPALSPANWSPVSGVSGNSVTVDFDAAARFYRLRKP